MTTYDFDRLRYTQPYEPTAADMASLAALQDAVDLVEERLRHLQWELRDMELSLNG